MKVLEAVVLEAVDLVVKAVDSTMDLEVDLEADLEEKATVEEVLDMDTDTIITTIMDLKDKQKNTTFSAISFCTKNVSDLVSRNNKINIY